LRTLVGSASLKETQGVSDSVMEGIYAHAYEFYQLSRFDDAEVFFRFLCLYDPFNSEYKMGLAGTLQQKKQYQNAIEVYEAMFAFAKNDYRPKLHIGQCYLFMKNKQQARDSFSVILESDAPAAIKAQAQAYLATIKLSNKTETTGNSEEIHASIK
jgi:type III secretion system low calcium response chaperone LcrH/SycD